MTPEERKQLQTLTEWKRSLERSSSIPIEIDQSFKERFNQLRLEQTKTVASETQAVNEAGSASYNVSNPPDAFLKVIIDAKVYYVPVFT
jgi:hypothetical protein